MYLLSIKLEPTAVSERYMLSLGFSMDDASHLRAHLEQFEHERGTEHEDAKYRGIRYFRVTYSVEPRSEITMNTGTSAGYALTRQQKDLIYDLMSTVKTAAACNPWGEVE